MVEREREREYWFRLCKVENILGNESCLSPPYFKVVINRVLSKYGHNLNVTMDEFCFEMYLY